jgi:hypothetical protein
MLYYAMEPGYSPVYRPQKLLFLDVVLIFLAVLRLVSIVGKVLQPVARTVREAIFSPKLTQFGLCILDRPNDGKSG